MKLNWVSADNVKCSLWRLVTNWLTLLVALLLILEGSAAIFFHTMKPHFLFYELEKFTISLEQIRGQNSIFDADLGWLKHFNTKFGERPTLFGDFPPGITVFGDSFAHGDNVSDAEVWTEHLAAALGRRVINLGVDGYGMDQSLLRFEKHFFKARAPIVLLEFISENINRNMNVYRKFYFLPTGIPMTKPRFEIEHGQLKLIPNPIRTIRDRDQLSDVNALRRIGEHDWWYNRMNLPVFGFPYTGILLNRSFWHQIMKVFRRQPSDIDGAPQLDLWEFPEPVELSFAIMNRFCDEARAQGVVPLIVHFPSQYEVREFRRIRAIPISAAKTKVECEKHEWNCLFPVFEADLIFPEATEAYFTKSRHYNARGNAAMAKWLFDHIDGRFPVRCTPVATSDADNPDCLYRRQ